MIAEVSENLRPHVLEIYFLCRDISDEFEISLESAIKIVDIATKNQKNDVLNWIREEICGLKRAVENQIFDAPDNITVTMKEIDCNCKITQEAEQ